MKEQEVDALRKEYSAACSALHVSDRRQARSVTFLFKFQFYRTVHLKKKKKLSRIFLCTTERNREGTCRNDIKLKGRKDFF